MSNSSATLPWSPFECLPVAELTLAGLLQRLDNDSEVELFTRQNTELRSATPDPMVPVDAKGHADSTAGKTWTTSTNDLTLTVTTHRLVFWKQQLFTTTAAKVSTTITATNNNNIEAGILPTLESPRARYIHMSHVRSATAETRMFTSPKILLQTYLGDFYLVFKTGDKTSKDRDDVLQCIQKSIVRKEWEMAERLAEKKKKQSQTSQRKVGVDAIVSKSALKHKEAAALTTTAFDGDIENLLREASELVNIIHKYVATLNRQQESGENNDNNSSSDESKKLADMLQDMGMTSALTKANFRGSDAAYYEQLARQLADFLRPKLQKVGGLMTLTDVYCLYNRARGSSLVAPDDLLKAVDLMRDLQLGMSPRTFPSGLIVIQDDRLNDKVVADRLTDLAQNGLTELEASRACQISVILAHEQLLAAEQAGYLVRDETVEGVRYYPNLFATKWCK